MRSYLTIFLNLFLVIVALGQIPSYVFHPLSIKDGLSEGTVRAISEDKRGFMWFGTEDGLNKYDGYKFTVYKSDPKDSFSINSNNIKCFYNDKEGNLWIGTRHGINIYDHQHDRFYNFNSVKYPVLKYIDGDIESIFEDKFGSIWVISSTQGLYKIITSDQKPKLYQFTSDQHIHIFTSFAIDDSNNFIIGTQDGLVKFDTKKEKFTDLRNLYGKGYYVREIKIDADKNIWMATTEGLKSIPPRSTSFPKEYRHNSLNENSINGNNTARIIVEKDNLLIAIDGNGIDLLNPKTGIFYHYTKETGSQLSSNNITAIYRDSKGTLWTGTFLNGINFSNTATNFFVIVKNNSSVNNSVKNGIVTNFLKDSKGNFWISTDGGGLNLKKKNTDRFVNFDASDKNPVIGSNAVLSLIEDKTGTIWISTYAGGLSRIKPSGEHTIFRHDPNNQNSLCYNKIKALCEYKDQIWVSSFGMGISVFDKKTERFHYYKNDVSSNESIPSDWLYWFLADSRNTLWMATFKGLTKYIPETDKFKTYQLNQDVEAQDKNYIFDIVEDKGKNLWLGTNGGGLVLFDRDSEKFTFYNKKNGLSDDVVKSIVEDNAGDLWLATNNGITKFNPTTRKATSYSISDGLPPSSFYYNSKYKDEQGKIYFGTNEGYLIIDPSLADATVDFPGVTLTELRIFNVPVKAGVENSPLDQDITLAKQMKVSYAQNSVTLEFAALNFNTPKHSYYTYMLEGFDKEWNYAGKSRIAKYTNLDPGTYIFKVKASNNEKVWGEDTADFVITITPPFWKTWWFRTLALMAGLLMITTFFYIRTRNIRNRNKWLTNQVEERTKELQETNIQLKEQNEEVRTKTETILEQQKELLDKKYTLEKTNDKLAEWNEFQQKLIGIIGHDIRGPLLRFSALLSLMNDESSREFVMEKMKESAGTLSLLATDLLSWISIQSAKSEIEKEDFQWKEVLSKAITEMDSFIQDKKIVLTIKHHNEEQKVEGVFQVALAAARNIIANAIRYSESGGVLEIETGIIKDGFSGIRITDYGKGFDAAEVNKLISGEGFKGMRSSFLQDAGLGMTICNDIMKRVGGWMEAVSLPGSGATFYVFLPVASSKTILTQEISETVINNPIQEDKTSLLKGKSVLIVDDDDEIRWSLVKSLSQYMQVSEVRSAEEAIEWMKKYTPSMTILDINMSGISGIELCRRIKNSPETSHLPCMVITGEVSEKNRLEVFEAGADAFLPKPFTSKEILHQIISYFENSEKKLKRFFYENVPLDEITGNAINKKFLEKLLAVTEKNLSSPDLDVEFLSKEMGMSKSTLYRNLKSLTGESANGFIKNIRLRKSLILLKEGKMNISEVATEIGFNSASYFTTTFKKHFGFNPTELK